MANSHLQPAINWGMNNRPVGGCNSVSPHWKEPTESHLKKRSILVTFHCKVSGLHLFIFNLTAVSELQRCRMWNGITTQRIQKNVTEADMVYFKLQTFICKKWGKNHGTQFEHPGSGPWIECRSSKIWRHNHSTNFTKQHRRLVQFRTYNPSLWAGNDRVQPCTDIKQIKASTCTFE
jgi:hypothetical protein